MRQSKRRGKSGASCLLAVVLHFYGLIERMVQSQTNGSIVCVILTERLNRCFRIQVPKRAAKDLCVCFHFQMRWLQTFIKVKTSANRIVKWQAAKPQKHKTDDVSCLPE